jgi:hypothetical protein
MKERSIFSQKVHQGRLSTHRLISNAGRSGADIRPDRTTAEVLLAKSARAGMPAVSWSIGH